MGKLKHKRMNSDVYRLRRRVMAMIYEAKKLVPSLPRITVRITDDHHTTSAMATLKRDFIEVSERAITCSDFDLRTIVYHELVHAVYGFHHDEACPLMRSIHKPLSIELVQSLFLKYAGVQQ